MKKTTFSALLVAAALTTLTACGTMGGLGGGGGMLGGLGGGSNGASIGGSGTQSSTGGSTNALGGMLGGLLGGGGSGSGNSQGLLGSLLSGLIGNAVPLTPQTVVGTWTYTSPDVRFESENFLAKAGGELAASTIEGKVAELYSMVGIKPGNCTFVFNADGSCNIQLGAIPVSGTWTLDAKNHNIAIRDRLGLVNINAKIYYDLNQLTLLFDANKLLSLAQTVGSIAGKGGGTLSSITALLGKYDGLMLGMNLRK